MIIDNVLVGKRIKGLRHGSDMSQKELAEKIGITQAQMSNIERGITSLTIELCANIAENLKSDVRYIILGEEEKTNETPVEETKLDDLEKLNISPDELIKILKVLKYVSVN